MNIRDRIVRFARVKASTLRPSPKNWRTHPSNQRDALKGVLADVGIAAPVIVRELPDGGLELVDGHLRTEELGDQEIPVCVLDVDENEAGMLLASMDPLSALAGQDDDKLLALLQNVSSDSPAVQAMLADLVSVPAAPVETAIPAQFQIILTCTDETQQSELLTKFLAEGLDCKALVS